MKPSLAQLATAVATLLCVAAASAQYVPGQQLVDVSLAGSSSYDGWTNLTAAANPGFPGFPGSGAWPSAIGSSAAGSGDALLVKTANGAGGGPYPAGQGLYFGGFSSTINENGGTLSVQDATPLAGLANVVFQIEIGEAWTHDFHNDVLPTLSYTTASGAVTGLVATEWALSARFDNGTVEMPTGDETVYINSYLLQWDLSDVGESITTFSISFTGVQHGQVYALQLDQGGVYTSLAAVPEPASFAALAGLGALALVATRRRRAD